MTASLEGSSKIQETESEEGHLVPRLPIDVDAQ